MNLQPAIHSTDEPPVEITDLQLKEYVNELRRRIEVQNILMQSITEQLSATQDHAERLSLDLAFYNQGKT
jgi:hypothetical protein